MDDYINNNKRAGFSNTFHKIINKYLKEERKKKLKLQFMKNPSQLLIEEIYNKKREKEMKEEYNFNNLLSEDQIDFDTHKFLIKNKKKIKKEYKSLNKKLLKYLFLNKAKNKNKKEIEKNNKNIFNLQKKKIINKSLSQNYYPSNINYKNVKVLKFPNIFRLKENLKNKINNNLLNKTKKESNLNIISNKNNNNKLKNSFSFTGIHNHRKQIVKNINKFAFYTYYYNKSINNYNKNNYYDKLNSLNSKLKEISQKISFYSTNENFYINEQIRKSDLLIEKYNNKKNYKSE